MQSFLLLTGTSMMCFGCNLGSDSDDEEDDNKKSKKNEAVDSAVTVIKTDADGLKKEFSENEKIKVTKHNRLNKKVDGQKTTYFISHTLTTEDIKLGCGKSIEIPVIVLEEK